MSQQYVFSMHGLSKIVEGKEIIKNTTLSFIHGAKIGIIGPNGAGKSTLLRIIAGRDTEFNGETWIADNMKVGFLEQEPKLDENLNVFENIMQGLKEKKKLLDDFNELSLKFAEPMSDDQMNDLLAKQAKLQDQIEASNGWDIEREIEIAMLALRCPEGDRAISSLSGGEKRRVALCKLLLEKPDMLLLDEPTNHLDARSVSWLQDFLQKYPGMVVTVTHDRYFLDEVTEWILEIDRGHCVPWHANYSQWLNKKQDKLSKESREESLRDKRLKKEIEWIKSSQKGTKGKNKARITSYQEMLAQKQDYSQLSSRIYIPHGPRLGGSVVEVKNLQKKFDDKVIFKDFSFVLPPGAIVGIIGENGAGKSTLFNIINKKIQPCGGDVHIGSTVKVGYVDQSRDKLNDKNNVWQEIAEGQEEIKLGDKIVKSRAYVASFNFKGGDQQKQVSELSGGERGRLHMAKLLKSGANLIMLDEPSNDLDIDTLRSLEDAILEFAGCVMVISHDRWFLDRIATHLIVFDDQKPGEPMWFEGNYADYKKYMKNTEGKDIENIKYRHKKLH